ncbi:MAG: hypothetical protein ABI644_06535 [Arenimonas sp.]
MSNGSEKEKTSLPRLLFEVVGFILLAFLAFQIVRELLKDDYSYGPDEIKNQELVLAPNISLELLPSARDLGNVGFKSFDISPKGTVLVGDCSRVFDLASGEALFDTPVEVHSFAFVGDALALVTGQGELGFYDGKQFRSVTKLPNVETGLMASSDRSRLFLYRESYDDSGNSPAIVSMRKGEAAEIVTGSFTPIKTIGGDAFQTYYADRNAIFQVVAQGQPSLVLTLPDSGQSILGLAAAGNVIYFSTAKAVYLLEDDVAIPLVIGIGGELRMLGADVYLLDSGNGRIYRIASKVAEAKK